MTVTSEGRTDRDFLYEIVDVLLEKEWAHDRACNDLLDVLKREAGGDLRFKNDSFEMSADVSISSSKITLKDIGYDDWCRENDIHE